MNKDLIDLPKNLKVVNQTAITRLGHVRNVIFDFDGTISVLRRGWEPVMIAMMVNAICGSEPYYPEVELEVKEYIDLSTGILTIEQMKWLEKAVERYALTGNKLSALEYKQKYLEHLMESVNLRIQKINTGAIKSDDMLIAGSVKLLEALNDRKISLYLTSGSDHDDVVNEVEVLGLKRFFNGRIYGALDKSDAHDKGRIITRVLEINNMVQESLLVIGDGPVEIRQAKAQNAVALGVASDEKERQGWNDQKEKRLILAGADFLVSDYLEAETLADVFCPK